ncbi:DUF1542 domain-containing protein [Streptococcus suis]
MSYKDMFRKEQRFSFRKFSFGLASAVIANVILGGAIANSPVVHANTVTEAQATAVSERIASIPYTVKIEDQTGKVVETKVKMVSVYTVETIATATDYLTADLVPEGYAIVSGLGEVTVTEKADNIFTVKVDKIAPEAVATTTTAESATSETAALIAPSDATTVASDVTKPATPEPASLTATQPTPVTSEVAEAEVAPTASEESAKPAERTVYLSYITQYVNEDRQVVDSKGHLVAVKTTDETAKTQVTVSVSKDVPAGYELVQAKPEITLQLVEKQINVLAFVVTKKSEEEEIAESQLSNRDVLMRLSLEANLLADEALRQVAKEQAGNTELATAANKAKEIATNDTLGSETKTEEELGEQVKTVRASIENLAAEMLKVDKDGILTAMLDASITNQAPVIPTIGRNTELSAKNDNARKYEVLHVFGNVSGTTEAESTTGNPTAPDFNPANAEASFPVTDPQGDPVTVTYEIPSFIVSYDASNPSAVVYDKNIQNADAGNIGKEKTTELLFDDQGRLKGEFPYSPGGLYSRIIKMTDPAGNVSYSNPFYVVAYTDKRADNTDLIVGKGSDLTATNIFNKLKIDTTSGYSSTNQSLTVPDTEYTRTIVGYRLTGTNNVQTLSDDTLNTLPAGGNYEIKVKTTNHYGQTIYNWIPVSIYKLKDTSRDTVDQYTDNPVPIHAIVELGSTGDVGTVKLEGVLPESFKLENFNLKDGVATELAKRNLEFVKAESVGVDGTVGTIRAKNGGKVEYTGSGNIDYGFVYSYMEGTETKTVDFTYTILFTDTQAPTVKPADEYIRVVGEDYTISVPGMDNAYLNPDKINGRLDIYENNVRFEGTSARGKLGVTSVVSKLDDSGKDTSGNSDDQGGNSTKFNINIVGTAPATAGTGIYYLRVGDDNYPSGPKGKKAADHPTNPNATEENVSVTPITITFVDKVKPITPIPVADQAHLTPTEKKAVIDAVKEANPDNAKLQALPESAFTVNSDGSVSVNYSDENVDGATDTIKNATTKLAGTQNEAKAEIDRKLAENKKAIEAKRDEAIAEINDDIYLTDVQKEVAREAVTAAAGDALKNLDTKATEAKENIDKATTVSEINNAKTDGEAALDNAEAVGEKAIDWTKEKERAKAEVENQSTDALEIINNNPNLSYEEKKAYFDAIDASKKAAIEKIDEAKDSVGITAAIDKAAKANETEVLKAAKQDALNKLEKDTAKAKEDVADNSNLTKEQSEKALEDIQNDLDKAKAAVNEAATPDAVQKEEDKGVAAIAKDVLDATKQNALNQLEKDAVAAKAAIATNPNLTKEQVDKAFEDVQNDLDKAKTAINEATTPDAVQAEMDKGVAALAKDVLDAAKQDAKNKIDKEAESAKTAIDASPNLTPEEKDVAKKAVEEAAKVATDAIDKATNLSDIQTAEDNGVKAIDVEELKAAQKDAKNKIAKEAESAKKAIDTNPNLTPEEKESAKKAIDTDAQAATAAIDKASTPDAVQVEEDKGVVAINLITAKADAKGAVAAKLADEIKKLEDKQAEAEKAIDTSTMTNEEKAIAKKALQDVVDKGKAELEDAARVATNEIHKATTAEDAKVAALAGEKSLTDAGKKARDAVELAKDKELAKEAIRTEEEEATKAVEKLAEDTRKAIEENPNLSDEDKQAEIKKLTDAVAKTLETIRDNATTAMQEAEKAQALADLEKAKETQKIADKAAIDRLTILVKEGELEATRRDALNQLEKDAARAKEDIAKNPNLTKEQVDKALEDVQKDLDKAKTAINEATTPDAVQAEMDKGVAALAKDVLDAAKQDAKNKIAKDAAAAKEAIDSNPNLSDEEKEAAKKAVDTDVQAATEAIDASTSPVEAQSAEDKGVGSIAQDVLDAAKQDAKNKIAKEVDAAKSAIDANPNLTDAEKKTFTDAVDAEVAKANDAISAATSPADVQKEEDAGVAAIAEDVLDAAKQDAKNKIAKEAESAKKAIDTNPNLTPEEKESAKKAIDTDAQAATAAIDKASTPDAVQVEEDKGVAAINLITAKADAKGAVAAKLADEIKKLEDKQAEAEKAIDTSTMTNEEKAIAKKALQDVVDKGKAELEDAARVATNEIHKATTAEDAKAAALAGEKSLTDAGKKARDAVELAKDKELAKEAIRTEEEEATKAVEKLAEDTRKAIEENPNLSDEDKQAEIKKLTDAVAKTLETIRDNATTAMQEAEKAQALADLEKAKETQKIADKAAIDRLTSLVKDGELEAAKQDAKNKIAKEVDAAKSAIDSNPNLTDAEKESAKKAVDTAAQAATEAIDASTSPVEAQSAEDKGVGAITKDVLDAAKQDAKNKIAKEVDAAKEAIDANPNLSDAEKEAAKKAVDADAQAATEVIDASTSPVEAQSAEDKGVGAITKDVLDAAKQDAKNKIAKEVDAAKEAIDANPNLTDAEKEASKKAVDADAQAATEAIDASTSPSEAQSAEDKGVGAIAKDVLDAAKQDAKNKIAKEVDAAKEAIDANPNLSDAEKEASKKAVDADAQAATEAIDASTSPVEAQSAEDKGVGSIAQDVLDAAKQDAKNKIAKVAESAKSAIDTNPNLTDVEKESAKKAVDADAQAATEAIDASTSPSDAQSAEDKGVGAIAKDVLDAAKQDAKNKIAKEAESAKSAIDTNPNLTDAEKESAKKAVDADAQAATEAIDASTSPSDAQSAEDKGVGAIAKDVLDAAKQDAKNKIGKEAESAKSAIDSNPNLTDAAKEAAKSEIDKAVEEAIVLINGVRTHQELEKIKLPMAALIKPAAKVTPVVDPNNLTEKEIARIKAFLTENNNLPEGTEINVSKDASVTIKYPDGTIDLLSPVEVVKQADKTAPTVANDGKGNIVIVPSEKAVEIVVSYVDNNGKPQTVVVTKGTDGLWTASNTVVIVDPVTGQVIVPGSVIKPGTVVTAYSKDEVGNSSDSAEAEVVAVDENNSAAGVKVKSVTTNANNVEKKAKQLPNTGEEASSATSLGLVALGLGLALLAAKRRRDEEA